MSAGYPGEIDALMEQLKPSKVFTSGPLDENTGQRAAFPGLVSKLSRGNSYRSGFSVPLDVNDYLASVMAEAQARSPIASVRQPEPPVPKGRRTLRSYDEDDDDAVMNKRFKVSEDSHTRIGTEPSNDIPQHASAAMPDDKQLDVRIDLEWRKHFYQRFSRYRIELEKTIAEQGKVGGSHRATQVKIDDLMDIDKNDLLNTRDVQHSETEEGPQSLSLHGARAWRRFLVNNEPSIDKLMSISFADTVRILHYYRKWVTLSMHPQLSHWLLFLFVKLPVILQGDDVAILRELARRCLRLLGKTGSDTPVSIPSIFILKAVIVIVTDHYHQLDLLESLA